MRLVPPLAARHPPGKRYRRVESEYAEQHCPNEHRRSPRSLRCHGKHAKAEPEQTRAGIAHEDARRGPVPHQKPVRCHGHIRDTSASPGGPDTASSRIPGTADDDPCPTARPSIPSMKLYKYTHQAMPNTVSSSRRGRVRDGIVRARWKRGRRATPGPIPQLGSARRHVPRDVPPRDRRASRSPPPNCCRHRTRPQRARRADGTPLPPRALRGGRRQGRAAAARCRYRVRTPPVGNVDEAALECAVEHDLGQPPAHQHHDGRQHQRGAAHAAPRKARNHAAVAASPSRIWYGGTKPVTPRSL